MLGSQMNIKLHENGWTGILEDFDFATATQEDINEIGKFLATNTLVVARGQEHLTVEDEVRIAHMFGNVENMNSVADQSPWNHLIVPNSNNEALRVTGELDEHGNPGLFGHVSDLDWHCNKPAVPTRMPLVWLLGIKGTAGSRTSWNNNILSYQDLTDELRDQIKDLKMVCGWKKGSYSEFSFSDKEEDFNEQYTPSLVHTNEGRKTGLFFPFLQFRNFVGMGIEESRQLAEQLRDHILQEKYIYHHDWSDGDVVIAEQWLGIHKRWRFEGMADRVLHRTTFDFANIDLT
jgi:alpha-ketoglutarate-dependent taurine dioxygenase